MKKTLTVIAMLAGAASVYAQGQVEFADYLPNFSVSIWSPQVANAGQALSGNSPGSVDTAKSGNPDSPAGTQSGYTGVLIGGSSTGTGATGYANGNNYTVQLYAGLTPTTMLAVTGAKSTMSTAGGLAGVWLNAITATVPGALAGTTVDVQVKAWYSGGGAATYEIAAATAGDPTGFSSIGTVALGGGSTPVPNLPGGTTGIQSFNLTTTPEPSTIALGIMGASAFLFRRRK